MGKTPEELGEENWRVLNKLCKWRNFFASWQVGTRPPADGEFRAIKDHREVTILLRADVNALAGLLIKKGVFTEEEFTEALTAEARRLDHDYEEHHPGWSSSDDGMRMTLPSAYETMKQLGFPP